MSKIHYKPTFSLMMVVLLLSLGVAIAPVSAQFLSPSIAVAPVWSPGLQLTSLDANGTVYPTWDSGDDYRYVDARLNVTTTVEFWAAAFSCTTNTSLLDTYTVDSGGGTTGDPGDDQPVVLWGPIWGNHVEVLPTITTASGQLKVSTAISKQGTDNPIGQTGVKTTLPLATLRFRVRPGLAGTPTLTCTFNFLDRNGRPVATASYQTPTPLTVITGYTITGTATYQSRTVKSGIGVACSVDGVDLLGSPKLTDAAGRFTYTNVRKLGFAKCRLYGNITNPDLAEQDDVYLSSSIGFDLNERGSFKELPIELKAGNLNLTLCGTPPTQCIDNYDIGVVTASYNQNAGGDVNGDGKTNEADLAIVASNIGKTQDVPGDHMLYSLARFWGTNGRESRIWLGEYGRGMVAQQVPSAANRLDFWATLSPDGSTIAFVRKTLVTGQPPKYELYKVASTGGTPTLLLSKANAGNRDAFAPSWSPDGTRLAFICSTGYGDTSNTTDAAYTGYGTNAGALCLVDANGRNFTALNCCFPGGADFGQGAKVFPPVWEGTWLIFGGNNGPQCPGDTLCKWDFSGKWPTVGVLDPDIPSGADMPIMSNGRLFYRYTAGSGNTTLRVIDGLDYASCDLGTCDYVKPYTEHPADCPSPATARPAFVHTNVVFDTDSGSACSYAPVTNGMWSSPPYIVSRYEVSPYGFDLLLNSIPVPSGFFAVRYPSEWGLDNAVSGPCVDGNTASDTDQCFPEWTNSGPFWPVDTQTADYGAGSESYYHSLFYVEQSFVDWTP